MPIVVDTTVAAGLPITDTTGTRVDAIALRIRDGFTNEEIAHDTGARVEEIEAVSDVYRRPAA